LSKIASTKKQTIEKPKNLNLLKTFPFENSFHFFTEHGKYTGITASSVVEFSEKLQTVPVQSVTFHFQRQDFQKWLKDTIGDEQLAKRIDEIKAGFQDEDLRKELSQRVQNRIAELQQHP
jgi:alpha-amylase